jgi:hypothetical protein
MHDPALIAHFAVMGNNPIIAGYKFVHDNQMLFYFIRDPGNVAVLAALNLGAHYGGVQPNPMLYHHELHIHYAAIGNGVITGANLRPKGAIDLNSIQVNTVPLAPIITKCLDIWHPLHFYATHYSNAHVVNW